MEQMPHHREGIQNELDKAYDEGHRDNKVINEREEVTEEKSMFEHWEDTIKKFNIERGTKIIVTYKDDVGHRVETGAMEFDEINPDFLIGKGHAFLGVKPKKVIELDTIVNIRLS